MLFAGIYLRKEVNLLLCYMDQNPIQNNTEIEPEGVVSEKISKSTMRVAYSAAGLVVLLTVLFYSYTWYIANTELSLQKNAEKNQIEQEKELNNLKKPWAQQNIDSTQVELNEFIADIDNQINNPNITVRDKKKLLLNKAMALGSTRSLGVQQDNIREAANILNSLYEVETTNTKDDDLKFATLSLYMSMLNSTCYYPELGNMLPDTYSSWYKELLMEERLPEKQAILLVFDRFVHEGNDPRYWNDSSTAMNRAYLLALYFKAYGSGVDPNELKPSDREAILWSKLQASVALGTTTEAILVTGFNRSVIDPAFRYAFSFDIAKTYANSDLDEKTNKEIDANYEKVFDLINENSNQGDVTSRAVASILNSIFYVESMHRRYARTERNEERIKEVIDIFMEQVLLNTDTRELYSGYFLEGVTKEGAWMPVRKGFIDLVPEYPKLDKFFSETFGID